MPENRPGSQVGINKDIVAAVQAKAVAPADVKEDSAGAFSGKHTAQDNLSGAVGKKNRK